MFLVGPQVASGYLDGPEETRKRFVTLPDGRLAYRTGDRASHCDDGLTFLGRADSQVNLLGRRIELGEVEAAVVRATQGRNAVALAWPPAPVPPATILAVVEAGDEDGFDPAELRRRLASRLVPSMVPSRIYATSKLPRNANGKVDREAVASWLAAEMERAPSAPSQVKGAKSRVADLVMEAVLEQAPHLKPSDILNARNLMDAGLDSLGFVGFTAALEEGLGLALDQQTIVELAEMPFLRIVDELKWPHGGGVLRRLRWKCGDLRGAAVESLRRLTGKPRIVRTAAAGRAAQFIQTVSCLRTRQRCAGRTGCGLVRRLPRLLPEGVRGRGRRAWTTGEGRERSPSRCPCGRHAPTVRVRQGVLRAFLPLARREDCGKGRPRHCLRIGAGTSQQQTPAQALPAGSRHAVRQRGRRRPRRRHARERVARRYGRGPQRAARSDGAVQAPLDAEARALHSGRMARCSALEPRCDGCLAGRGFGAPVRRGVPCWPAAADVPGQAPGRGGRSACFWGDARSGAQAEHQMPQLAGLRSCGDGLPEHRSLASWGRPCQVQPPASAAVVRCRPSAGGLPATRIGKTVRHCAESSGQVRPREPKADAVRSGAQIRLQLVCRFRNDVCSSGRVSSQGRDAGGLAGRHILKQRTTRRRQTNMPFAMSIRNRTASVPLLKITCVPAGGFRRRAGMPAALRGGTSSSSARRGDDRRTCHLPCRFGIEPLVCRFRNDVCSSGRVSSQGRDAGGLAGAAHPQAAHDEATTDEHAICHVDSESNR